MNLLGDLRYDFEYHKRMADRAQALLRGLSHAAYHTGQILYLVRLWRPDSPWLTIPPGQSRKVAAAYFRGHEHGNR